MGSIKIDVFIDPILNYMDKSGQIRKYLNFTYKAQKYKSQLLLELVRRVLKKE